MVCKSINIYHSIIDQSIKINQYFANYPLVRRIVVTSWYCLKTYSLAVDTILGIKRITWTQVGLNGVKLDQRA